MEVRSVSPLSVLVAAALIAAVVIGALLVARPGPPASAGDGARLWSVVVIDLPGVRPDHLGVHGYGRDTTPRLTALCERAVVFEAAYAPAVTTLPSTASLLTGLRPRAHGLLHPVDRLAESYPTLAELLRQRGVRTAAFVDGVHLERRYGLDQGFEVYDDARNPGGQRVNGLRRFLPRALQWLERTAPAPFFLYLQSYDASAPFFVEPEVALALGAPTPPGPEDEDRVARLAALDIHRRFTPDRYASFAALVDEYDATLRFVDAQVGAVVDRLEQLGRLDDTLLVVTAPHGTSLFDRGLYAGHGLSLADEEVRVPLVVKFPDDRFGGTRCADVVRRVDVLPTALAALGAERPDDVAGDDLARLLEGADAAPRVAYGTAPLLYRPGDPTAAGRTSFVRRGGLKLVGPPQKPLETLVHRHLHRGEGSARYDLAADPLGLARRVPVVVALFDLAADPGERNDLSAARSGEVRALQQELARIEAEDNAIRDRHLAAARAAADVNR